MYAAKNGDASLVRLLLAHSANPNLVIPKGTVTLALNGENVGQTALTLTALYDQKRAAQKLLAGGAHVNVVAADGNTALSWAALKGHFDLVALLLAHGARSRLQNRAGHTPLALARTQKRQQLLNPPFEIPTKPKIIDDRTVVYSPPGITMAAWLQARTRDYDKTIRLLQHPPQ